MLDYERRLCLLPILKGFIFRFALNLGVRIILIPFLGATMIELQLDSFEINPTSFPINLSFLVVDADNSVTAVVLRFEIIIDLLTGAEL